MTDCYIAGLFDGEGSVIFGTSDRSHGWYRAIQIVNTHRQTLTKVQRVFGGHIYKNGPNKHHLGKRVIYTWKLYASADLHQFVRRLLPFAQQKKRKLQTMQLHLNGRISYAEARRRTRRR